MTVRATYLDIGVTGSREGPVTEAQANTAEELLAWLYVHTNATYLHHGDCVGADEWFATRWSDIAGRESVIAHPPTDERLRAFHDSGVIRPARAYLRRNRDIVDASDLVIALPKDEGHAGGTGYTIGYTRDIGTQLIIVYTDGSAWVESNVGWSHE